MRSSKPRSGGARRSNDNVATFIKELVLELPEGEQVDFKSGGYIQIEARRTPSSTRTLTSTLGSTRTGTSTTSGDMSPRSTSR